MVWWVWTWHELYTGVFKVIRAQLSWTPVGHFGVMCWRACFTTIIKAHKKGVFDRTVVIPSVEFIDCDKHMWSCSHWPKVEQELPDLLASMLSGIYSPAIDAWHLGGSTINTPEEVESLEPVSKFKNSRRQFFKKKKGKKKEIKINKSFVLTEYFRLTGK